jgi:hypothetical protein
MKQTKRILLQAMMRGYWQAFPSPASDSIRRTFLVGKDVPTSATQANVPTAIDRLGLAVHA